MNKTAMVALTVGQGPSILAPTLFNSLKAMEQLKEVMLMPEPGS